MSKVNSPKSFAEKERAAIVAPAGYGKTELIAQSVACCDERQLVLTHTHAGVDSLRKRLKEKYKIPSSRYQVETIHSFALRFAGSYPNTTGLSIQKPQESKDYLEIISAAVLLFDTKLGKDILKSSYRGVFVDEYQDCDINQHQLICKLAAILPCRIVGDHLQGIYGFGETQIVSWKNDVETFFEILPELEIPHRWKNTNPKLGEKLKELRQMLLDKKELPFRKVESAGHGEIESFLRRLNCDKDKVFVICDPSPEGRYFPHTLAKAMKNKYLTIEPLTSNTLHKRAVRIEQSNGVEKLRVVTEFSQMCLTEVSTENRDVYLSVTKRKKKFTNERKKKLEQYFLNIINDGSIKFIYDLFVFYEQEYAPTYKRQQLWREMKGSLHEVICGGADSLEDAVWQVRNRMRYKTNRIPNRCISRTVLLKGLECDHAIIIKPELFDAKNLYVALTRASSRVTIISDESSWCNY